MLSRCKGVLVLRRHLLIHSIIIYSLDIMCQSSTKSLNEIPSLCSLQSFRKDRSAYLNSVLTLTLENVKV